MARKYLRDKLTTAKKGDIIFLREEKDKAFIIEENHKNYDYFKTSYITYKEVNGKTYEITNLRNITYEDVDEIKKIDNKTGEPCFFYININPKNKE